MLRLVSGFGKDGNFSCWNLLHFSVNGVGVGSTYHLVQLLGLVRPNRVLFYSILFFFFFFWSVDYISWRFLGEKYFNVEEDINYAQGTKPISKEISCLHVNLSM